MSLLLVLTSLLTLFFYLRLSFNAFVLSSSQWHFALAPSFPVLVVFMQVSTLGFPLSFLVLGRKLLQTRSLQSSQRARPRPNAATTRVASKQRELQVQGGQLSLWSCLISRRILSGFSSSSLQSSHTLFDANTAVVVSPLV